jgi:Zn-finger nucleic acid-binding protein
MQRRNFGKTSGVIVDVCAQHGTWFDPGELSRVLAFVEAGGLAEARRYQLGLPKPTTDAARRRVASAVAAAMNPGPGSRGAAPSGAKVAAVATGVLESSLELLAALGDFVMGDPP